MATLGKIGPFTITDQGLENITTSDAYIRHQKVDLTGTVISEAVLGTRSVPFFGDNYVGYFANDTPGNAINNALYVRASKGTVANHAISIDGGIFINGNSGKTFNQDIGGGFALRFVDGIYIETIAIP
jgi:hypothetical protein